MKNYCSIKICVFHPSNVYFQWLSHIQSDSITIDFHWFDGEVMFTQWKRPACKSQAEKMSQMGKRFMNYDDLKQFSIGDHIPVFSFHHAQCKYAWDDHQHIFVIASIASEKKGKSDLLIATPYVCMHAFTVHCACILARDSSCIAFSWVQRPKHELQK